MLEEGKLLIWNTNRIAVFVAIMFGFFGFVVFGLNDAHAEDTAAKKLSFRAYVRGVRENLVSSPGGAKQGEIYRNANVKVTEIRGAWSKVHITGWMRSNKLVARKSGVRPEDLGSDALSLQGFEIKKPEMGALKDEVKSVYLVLDLKNNLKLPVKSWKATLVVKQDGKLLFREPLRYSVSAIPAKASSQAVFSWKEGERPYDVFQRADPSSLKVELLRLKVK